MASLNLQPGETDLRKIVDVVRQLVEGKSNAVGVFTLTSGTTTTTVKATTCSPGSVVLLGAMFPDAANDMATTSYVAGTGQFVLTHANNARTDRTFGFFVVG